MVGALIRAINLGEFMDDSIEGSVIWYVGSMKCEMESEMSRFLDEV